MINTIFKDILRVLLFEKLNKKGLDNILNYIDIILDTKYHIDKEKIEEKPKSKRTS